MRIERGLVTVMFNLGEDGVEFERPSGAALVLASGEDVAVTERSVMVPPNRVAIFSGEQNKLQ